jgi:NDP-sugar pyrophosphorylase family protein
MGIHLVIPMGGEGSRFADEGIHLPKPLIEIQGKPFFYWAVQSVTKFVEVQDIIFVVLQEHIDRFSIDSEIRKYYPDSFIRVIPHVLKGAVLTCYEGIKDIQDDLPVLFNDCDHAFLCRNFYDYCERGDFDIPDGALLTFKSSAPDYSYVQFDENGNVIHTAEKKVISQEAICGAYYFRNKSIFSEAAEAYLRRCIYKEFFMSGVYNVMADMGQVLRTFQVDEHISFGTPNEYENARKDSRLGILVSER